VGSKPISRTDQAPWFRARFNKPWPTKPRKSVTLVHKGNIQKFTEGGSAWGYELVQQEFRARI